jgi:hypothetical protein
MKYSDVDPRPRLEEPCPRCGEHSMREPLPTNALSRTTRGTDDVAVWVCSDCGTDEAFEDLGGGATLQKYWPLPFLTFESLIK